MAIEGAHEIRVVDILEKVFDLEFLRLTQGDGVSGLAPIYEILFVLFERVFH